MNHSDDDKNKSPSPLKYGLFVRPVLICILAVTVCLSLFCSCSSSGSPYFNSQDTYFCFLDVGQGDACLVRSPDAVILVDTGGNATEETLLTQLELYGITRIDLLVISHAHEDHIGAGDVILDSIPVGAVLMPRTENTGIDLDRFLSAAESAGVSVIEACAGVTVTVGGLRVECLSPVLTDTEDTSRKPDGENSDCAVVKITSGNASVLFMADAGFELENSLMSSCADGELSATVLKVGHHGSSSSSSYEFLERVRPQYAVISVGRYNSYGHPSMRVIEDMEQIGVTVLRTDKDGTVFLRFDGDGISVETH